ncbi:probable histone chaperone ASF1A [Tanacetum coccineum]
MFAYKTLDLELKLTYVGSATDETYVKVFESVLVGPINVGKYRFVFEIPNYPTVNGCFWHRLLNIVFGTDPQDCLGSGGIGTPSPVLVPPFNTYYNAEDGANPTLKPPELKEEHQVVNVFSTNVEDAIHALADVDQVSPQGTKLKGSMWWKETRT